MLRDGSMVFIVALFVLAYSTSFFSQYLDQVEEDNAFEELLEDMIEDQTGLDIDVTPESPEDD